MSPEEAGKVVALAFTIPLGMLFGLFCLIELGAYLCGGRFPWWPKDSEPVSFWKDLKEILTTGSSEFL